MAVTIVRTPWVDDDGTGTTGTVINNAVKTALYNDIDGALAKVAQLAGGNTFTGNQAIAGLLSVTGFGAHSVTGTGTGIHELTLRNLSPGSGNFTRFSLGTDTDPFCVMFRAHASNYVGTGLAVANGGLLYANGSGGLSLAAADPAGTVRVYAGGSTERVRITATGEVLINSAVNAGAAQLLLVSDQAHTGFVIQNTNPANGMTLQYFMNSAGGGCGSITQTGASSCSFNTGSDARLKDDAGRATDLSALRAVVVHDFAWKADGFGDRGVFAQEAHALFPRAVTPGDDDTTDDGLLAHPWQTDYSKFVPDLIVGWQQHDAELAELRALLATVKGSR